MTSFAGVIAACCAVGALTAGATMRLGHTPSENPRAIPAIATEEYGKRLLAQTPELLGPDVADSKMRYIASRLSCGSCHLGTGAEPFGHLRAHLDDAFGLRHCEGLRVGIGDDEVDTLEACRDHVVHGIAAGAADTEYGNSRFHFANVRDLQIDGHWSTFLNARAAGLSHAAE